MPTRRINEIVKGKRALTADTALRLGRYFKMSPQFWLNLQSHYDLELQKERLGRRLEREVKVLQRLKEYAREWASGVHLVRLIALLSSRAKL